jgi:hypothetical protein
VLAGLAAEHAAGNAFREDFGVLVRHPGGDGIGGRAEDDLDAGLAHGVDDAVHPGVFEAAVFGLPEAPGGLAHADDVEAGAFMRATSLARRATWSASSPGMYSL